MFQCPPSTPAELSHHSVTVAQKRDIKVDVVDWLPRDVDLWNISWDVVWSVSSLVHRSTLTSNTLDIHFGDRRHFHRSTNDDNQVYHRRIVLG